MIIKTLYEILTEPYFYICKMKKVWPQETKISFFFILYKTSHLLLNGISAKKKRGKIIVKGLLISFTLRHLNDEFFFRLVCRKNFIQFYNLYMTWQRIKVHLTITSYPTSQHCVFSELTFYLELYACYWTYEKVD